MGSQEERRAPQLIEETLFKLDPCSARLERASFRSIVCSAKFAEHF